MLIRQLEEISNNALPVKTTFQYDGWLLRLSTDKMRRANSVSPHYESTLPLEDKIAFCEAFYRKYQKRIVFKITPAAQPSPLETVLTRQGYQVDMRTHVLTRDLDLPPFQTQPQWQLETTDHVTASWIQTNAELHTEVERPTLGTLTTFEAIIPQTGYFRLFSEGRAVACALAVIDQGWVGLYNVVVDETFRGQGIARYLMQSILLWAKQQGAHHVYLQVMMANNAANSLYNSVGFQRAYDYWYLQKD